MTIFCARCGNFGVSDCSYVCAGGRGSGGGGGCDKSACSSGQYAFDADGCEVTLTAAQAGGKTPYRAFAYLPFCHGQKIGSCVATTAFSFSVTFRTDDLTGWGAYAKLLFWTDSGNILGLLPPGAPAAQGNGSYRLLIFPRDDYPNEWAGEVEVQDGRWYSAVVTVEGSTTSVSVAGQTWSTDLGVDFAADLNGPQLGLYTCTQLHDTYGIYDNPACDVVQKLYLRLLGRKADAQQL